MITMKEKTPIRLMPVNGFKGINVIWTHVTNDVDVHQMSLQEFITDHFCQMSVLRRLKNRYTAGSDMTESESVKKVRGMQREIILNHYDGYD